MTMRQITASPRDSACAGTWHFRSPTFRRVLVLDADVPGSQSGSKSRPHQIHSQGIRQAIKEGTSLFRGNCSPCHGLNAHGGGRGPDLTSGRWTHGSSDAEIFHTITQGVPGTQMPANGFEDSETWAIIAYLRTLTPSSSVKSSGDPAKGKRIFHGAAGCSTCHMVDGAWRAAWARSFTGRCFAFHRISHRIHSRA